MPVSFSIRVPDEIHAKLRVISAFVNTSLNAVVIEAIKASISRWEQKHGPVPLPPEEYR